PQRGTKDTEGIQLVPLCLLCLCVAIPFARPLTVEDNVKLRSNMERIALYALLGFLFLTLTGTALYAQAVSTAQISGTVKDQSGAVLPGVEVSVIQTATGLKRSVPTDETGSYVLTNLPIGPYRLEAALPSFRTYVQTGI